MKYNKTRKFNRKTNMYGGQSPSAYSASASDNVILEKLLNLRSETATLATWAETLNTITQTLNNPDTMKSHLEIATNINNKGEEVYASAQLLWKSIYGSAWVPPPSPMPAPSPGS